MKVSFAATFFLGSASVSIAQAWILPSSQSKSVRSPATHIFNIPAPSTEDKEAFKAYANKQAPPASFFELQQDCIRSAKVAIRDGYQLLEVEFPPLPANVLELDDVSAYDVAAANMNLAVQFARGFVVDNQKVAILLPDESEAQIAIERWTGKDDFGGYAAEVEAGVTISSLCRSEEGDDRLIKVRELNEV
jgi:hypothetical protein